MADSLSDILNWRRVDERTTLSGQPTAAQLGTIRGAGATQVINLGPHDSPNALPGEPELVAALGMAYTYIPVDFEAPSETDYQDFCKALEQASGDNLHIHCIYNARVSAFMLRYAKDGRGGSVPKAQKLMHSIWRPGGVWAAFLGDLESQNLPHRYAGHDY